jgi:hypothetical protein
MPKEINGIPIAVFEEYESIRQSGITNMFDVKTVKRIAEELEYDSLLEYCGDFEKYAKVLENYTNWHLEYSK